MQDQGAAGNAANALSQAFNLIDRNAERMNRSAPGVCMPTIPVQDQVDAILALLDVDRLWFPEQDGASLYIRPFMIGTQDSLGVKPSNRYLFCVFLSPSGPYYPAGFTAPVKLLITRRFHRAAPGGSPGSSAPTA